MLESIEEIFLDGIATFCLAATLPQILHHTLLVGEQKFQDRAEGAAAEMSITISSHAAHIK